jgi:hypothetical protein
MLASHCLLNLRVHCLIGACCSSVLWPAQLQPPVHVAPEQALGMCGLAAVQDCQGGVAVMRHTRRACIDCHDPKRL